MGEYTTISLKGIVKKEYREEIKRIKSLEWDWSNSKFDFMKQENYYRKVIPGSHTAMNEIDELSEYYNPKTGEWSFECTLKNYPQEDNRGKIIFGSNPLKRFYKEVLVKILSEAQIKKRMDAWYSADVYTFKNGELKHLEKHEDDYTRNYPHPY